MNGDTKSWSPLCHIDCHIDCRIDSWFSIALVFILFNLIKPSMSECLYLFWIVWIFLFLGRLSKTNSYEKPRKNRENIFI
jgi:hypothetical protein